MRQKKIIATVIAVLTTLPTSVTSAYAATDSTSSTIVSTYLPGDIDNNGIINALDASAVLTIYVQGTESRTANELAVADFNNDGIVNSIDASAILTYYVSGNNTAEITSSPTEQITTTVISDSETETTTTTTTAQSQTFAVGDTISIGGVYVPLRSTPNSDIYGNILYMLNYGDTFVIEKTPENGSSWYLVNYQETYGYVQMDNLYFKKISSPTTTTTTTSKATTSSTTSTATTSKATASSTTTTATTSEPTTSSTTTTSNETIALKVKEEHQAVLFSKMSFTSPVVEVLMPGDIIVVDNGIHDEHWKHAVHDSNEGFIYFDETEIEKNFDIIAEGISSSTSISKITTSTTTTSTTTSTSTTTTSTTTTTNTSTTTTSTTTTTTPNTISKGTKITFMGISWNIRSAANLSSTVVGYLDHGETITILEYVAEGPWYKIVTKDNLGGFIRVDDGQFIVS